MLQMMKQLSPIVVGKSVESAKDALKKHGFEKMYITVVSIDGEMQYSEMQLDHNRINVFVQNGLISCINDIM